MSFTWRKFTVLGFCLALPFVAFIARQISEEKQSAFEAWSNKLCGCKTCDKLFPHYLIRMMAHLQENHGISENESINIVEDLYRRFRAAKYKKWEVKDVRD